MSKRVKGPYRRGENPNSKKNLRPIQPGECKNPTGKNGQHPYTQEYMRMSEDPLPEKIRRRLNDLLKNDPRDPDPLPEGTTWKEAVAIRMHLEAVLKGSVFAANHLVDNVEGRAVARVALTDAAGNSLAPPSLTIFFADEKSADDKPDAGEK